MTISILWLRRDLRLGDHPALLAAGAEADEVIPLFVLDDRLLRPSGAPRLAFLCRCLRDLDDRTGGRLVVRTGDPAQVVPAVAREVEATGVHVSADYGPYGADRDRQVERALARDGRELRRTGSPYAVAPGRLTKADGTPYRVFTPFFRAWQEHGVRSPATGPEPTWARLRSDRIPPDPDLGVVDLPPAGEGAGLARLGEFVGTDVRTYHRRRDLPGVPATSRLSVYLKYGCVHPRTVLAELGGGAGDQSFRSELAWREFYADVLFARPDSARVDLTRTLAAIPYDEPDDRFEAWKAGRTGLPIVDAGMRQLLATGWMHNRVRMITASFVTKDLHLWWPLGARWFMDHLVDGDLASNNHGWQWVAGTGTDAAPYFRVFNPITQGRKFDPDGEYVRRWVPELRDIAGAAVHEPWTLPGGPPTGYPAPVVDHAAERREALDRYQAAKN